MRFQFLLLPPVLIAGTAVQAATYLSVEEAQATLFPGSTFTPADVILDEEQVDTLVKTAKSTVFRSRIKAWKVSAGGWFILDQVPGRDDRITYAVGIDEVGAVTGIEILTCESGYEGVRASRWRNQFRGTRHATAGDLAGRISNISGTTLSVEHITEGVKRVLATYALFIESQPR